MSSCGERYIWHVTLNTGDTRRSPRSEVSDEAVIVCRDLIDRATAGAEPRIPGQDATLTMAAEGRCALATVWALADHAPLVTIGFAAHSRCAPRLWEILHDPASRMPQQPPIATRIGERPDAPWCAARIEIGLALHVEDAHWLGDFERCLAWAWIER